MIARFRLASILTVCFFSELDLSTAFPRGRRFAYSETQQGVNENQQDLYGFGNRRPLHYVQELRQSHRELESTEQVQADNWQSPRGRTSPDTSNAQIPYQPSPYAQTQILNQQWSAAHSTGSEGMFPPQSPPMPRSFSINLPFVSITGHNKERGSFIEGSNLNSGESDDADGPEMQRPSSIWIQAGSKYAPKDTKPSFQFGMYIPIPTKTPSTPSSTTSGSSRKPGNSGQPGKNLQHAGHRIHKPVHPKRTDDITISAWQASKPTTPTAPSQDKIPTRHSWQFPQSSQRKHPAPFLPVSYYQQPASVFSEYYSGQTNPTIYQYWRPQSGQGVSDVARPLFPSQYEERHHSFGLVNPSSNHYGQHQTWQRDNTPLNFRPFEPIYGGLQIVPLPLGYNKEVDTATYVAGDDFYSFSPHQYSRVVGRKVEEKPKYSKLHLSI